MSAIEERIAEALADHIGRSVTSTRRILVAVLAGLVREAQAEAWEEGRDVEFQRSVMKRQVDPNPYRIGADE